MFELPTTPDSLKRRFQLIERNKIYDARKLWSLLQKKRKGEFDDNDRTFVYKLFHSDEHGFDDLYLVKLAFADILINIDSKSDRTVELLHWNTEIVELINNHRSCSNEDVLSLGDLSERRRELKELGGKLLRIVVEDVSARLAFLEILCVLNFEGLVCDMIEITPRYLQCPKISGWIETNQFHYTNSENLQARENLGAISSSIIPDKRKKAKSKKPEWISVMRWKTLTDYIVFFRKKKKSNHFDRELLNIFFEVWKIPDSYRGLFESDSGRPKDIAAEIMIDQGLSLSQSTLRDIQTRINKLEKKHKGVFYTPIIGQNLDIGLQSQKFFKNPKLWDYLE